MTGSNRGSRLLDDSYIIHLLIVEYHAQGIEDGSWAARDETGPLHKLIESSNVISDRTKRIQRNNIPRGYLMLS